MNLMTISAPALCLLAFVTGCGGTSSGNAPTGNVCSKTANPIPVELKTGQKIDLDPAAGEITALPGKYQFRSAEVFYKNQKTGLMIHIKETGSRVGNKPVTGIACVAGFDSRTQAFVRRTTMVYQMEVLENNRVNFSVRDYLIGLSNRIVKDAAPGAGEFESPKKVYDGISSEFAFYKTKPKDPYLFETRSITRNGDESIATIVRYRRCGFDGKDCPAEIPNVPTTPAGGSRTKKDRSS